MRLLFAEITRQYDRRRKGRLRTSSSIKGRVSLSLNLVIHRADAYSRFLWHESMRSISTPPQMGYISMLNHCRVTPPALNSRVLKNSTADDQTSRNHMRVQHNTLSNNVQLLNNPGWPQGGLMVSALDSGASGSGWSPGQGHYAVFLGRHFTLTAPLSTQVYK